MLWLLSLCCVVHGVSLPSVLNEWLFPAATPSRHFALLPEHALSAPLGERFRLVSGREKRELTECGVAWQVREWFVERGGWISSSVEFRAHTDKGMGYFAAQSIAKDEELIVVPRAAALEHNVQGSARSGGVVFLSRFKIALVAPVMQRFPYFVTPGSAPSDYRTLMALFLAVEPLHPAAVMCDPNCLGSVTLPRVSPLLYMAC